MYIVWDSKSETRCTKQIQNSNYPNPAMVHASPAWFLLEKRGVLTIGCSLGLFVSPYGFWQKNSSSADQVAL